MGKKRKYNEKEERFWDRIIEHLERKPELDKNPRGWGRSYIEDFIFDFLLPKVKDIARNNEKYRKILETEFSKSYTDISISYATIRRIFKRGENFYGGRKSKLLFTLYCAGFSVSEYHERYIKLANANIREKIGNDGLPFPGFMPLPISDKQNIYGRDNEIKAIENKINKGCKFLIINGKSGIGKSSFLRAGIISGLNSDKINLPNIKFEHVLFRPYDNPFRSLISNFANKYPIPGGYGNNLSYLYDKPERFSKVLRNIVSEILEKKLDETELVFCIDQMEELFSFDFSLKLEKEKNSMNQAFVEMMYDLSKDLPVRVLGTIREDFVNRLKGYDFLNDHEGWLFDLQPLSRENLVYAFSGLMNNYRWRCDDNLVEDIVTDSGPDYTNATPVVALAIEKLQRRSVDRDQKFLKRSDYVEMGRLDGLLQQIVDAVMPKETEDYNNELEILYLGLARVIDGRTTRRQLHPEVLAKSEVLKKLSEELIRERVLTRLDEGHLEITHEKVVEAWTGFKQYLDEHNEEISEFCRNEQKFIDWSDIVKKELNFPKVETRAERIAAMENKVAAEKLLLSSQEEIDFMKLQLKKYKEVFSEKKLSEFERYIESSKDYHDRQKLINTIDNGRVEEIIELLDEGIELKRTDIFDNRIEPVFYAALTGDDDKSTISLLENYRGTHPGTNWDINTIAGSILNQYNALFTTKKNLTPLHLAIIAGQVKMIRKLFLLGVNPNLTTVDSSTPLDFALKYSTNNIVSFICRYGPFLTDCKINNAKYDTDDAQWTNFQYAAYGGKTDFLEAIECVDIDEREFGNGWTPLALAVQKKDNIDATRYLLAKGANPNAYTDWGGSVLSIASSKGNLEIVKLLLGHLALEDEEHLLQPLWWAAFKGHYKVFQELINNCRGQISNYIYMGHTIATRIVSTSSIEEKDKLVYLKLLKEKGVDFTVRNNVRKTALNYVDSSKQDELVDFITNEYPGSWKIENKSARTQEIKTKYGENTVWPDCSLIQCKWEYLTVGKASDILNLLTEFYITENNFIPPTLGYRVISLRKSDLSCLKNWRLYEVLIEENDGLYVLSFISDGTNIKILDGKRTVFDHLWSTNEIVLNTRSSISEFVILYTSFVQKGNGHIGRLIAKPTQLKCEDEEILDEEVSELINVPQLIYDEENQLIQIMGTFLYSNKLYETSRLLLLSENADADDLWFIKTHAHSKLLTHTPLPLVRDKIISHLRLIRHQLKHKTLPFPIIGAIKANDINQVKQFFLNGESPNKKLFAGNRPLHYACYYGDDYSNIVELLLMERANPNIRNDKMVVPLHTICANNHHQLLEMVLSHAGTNVNLQSASGMTALMMASREGFMNVVGVLIGHGALTEIEDLSGNTALFHAVACDNWGIARFLISEGADIGHINDKGESIMDIWEYYTCSDKAENFRYLAKETSLSEEVQQRVLKFLKLDEDASENIAYKALEGYQNPKMDWPDLPKFQKEWSSLSQEEAFYFARNFDKYEIDNKLGRTFNRFKILDARSINFEFYRDLTLVEFYLENVLTSKHAVISFMFRENVQDKEDNLVILNGNSTNIHMVNFEDGLSFKDDNRLYLDYLRFFCSYVWGKNGGFWIVDNIDDLPLTEPLDEKTINSLEENLVPLESTHQDEDGLQTSGCVLYKDQLFKADFTISPLGKVRMDEDYPLNIELPVQGCVREGKGNTYRIV